MPVTTFQRGMIGRTVCLTHCEGFLVKDGAPVAYKNDLIGDYRDISKATNTLRRREGDNTITITRTEVDSDYYSIPIQLFVMTAINYRKELKNGRD